MSNPYLSQIERGLRKPSAEVLAQIASALRVSTPLMYLRAGLLNERDGQGVLAAIAADPDLTLAQKQSLTQIYETFRRENARADIGRSGQHTTRRFTHHEHHHNTTKIPAPVYAVAGAGDLAYRQLLKLPAWPSCARSCPARVAALRAELPARVEQLRAELPGRVDAAARRAPGPGRAAPGRVAEPGRGSCAPRCPAAVNTFVAEAVQVYSGLVARGDEGGRRCPYPPDRDRSKATADRRPSRPRRRPATRRPPRRKATKATKATRPRRRPRPPRSPAAARARTGAAKTPGT